MIWKLGGVLANLRVKRAISIKNNLKFGFGHPTNLYVKIKAHRVNIIAKTPVSGVAFANLRVGRTFLIKNELKLGIRDPKNLYYAKINAHIVRI